MTNSVNWAPLPDLLGRLGIQAGDVTKIVIGHGHWDHAGTLSDFPNAVLYVQKAELEGIEWALNYPNPRIAAVNTSATLYAGFALIPYSERPVIPARQRRAVSSCTSLYPPCGQY
jgi:glyoxylase-like metal-dependent hydrolase (beta-lactamase superfamily II)